MNLGDLLAELRQGILNDRSDRTAGTSDFLWTDASLVRYINEAQRKLAVEGLVIRDSTTPQCTVITLVAGQDLYPLDASVIGVVSAKISTATADLPRVGHSFLAAYRPPSETWFNPTAYAGLPPGPPVVYTTDESVMGDDDGSRSVQLLRVYPVPDTNAEGTIINLRVVRKPLDELTVDDLSAVPEVPADHHIEMLDWAAYLALRIVDDDAGTPIRAMQFAASFDDNISKVRRLAMRKLFAPMPWGFGRGGFSWEP